MVPTHYSHPILQLPSPSLFELILTLSSTFSTSSSSIKNINLKRARIRADFKVTSVPSINNSTNSTHANKKMFFIIFGVVAGLIVIFLCCYAVQRILSARRRREMRAVNKSINARRSSVDSVWGISGVRRGYESSYDRQTQGSVSAPTLGGRKSSTMEQGKYKAWGTRGGEGSNDVQAWGVEQPPAYHAGGYAGVPVHDVET